MIPALTHSPPLALPVPATHAATTRADDEDFNVFIARAVRDAGVHLVFRVPVRPGTRWREVAALAGERNGHAAVALLALEDDGATMSIAPDDPDLAPYAGLARSWADLMTRWVAG